MFMSMFGFQVTLQLHHLTNYTRFNSRMTEANSFLTNIKNFLHFNEKDFQNDNN